MIQHPGVNPEILHIYGPMAIRWYGLMYLAGITLGWFYSRMRARALPDWDDEMVNDLIFYAVVGLLLGGRIGYMIFYKMSDLWSDPLSLFKMWEGGMSFHGGLLGVVVALMLFVRKYKKSYFDVSDFIAPAVPIGLFFGRIGNFIGSELVGKPTDVPWGVLFPGDVVARHPSQLYEAFLEGGCLFMILATMARMSGLPKKVLTGTFLLGYGVFRIFVEFYREPDFHIGYVAYGWVTKGQLLSLPMVIAGLAIIAWGLHQNKVER